MNRTKQINPDKARLKMADLCARSEQCEHDIREKLKRYQLSSRDIDGIISFLSERHFIDNARFAKSFTNDKVRFSGWGRNKIRLALKMKKISYDDINSAFENIDESEYNHSLARVAKSKCKGMDLTDYEQRNKLFRYLLSRGYESAKISKIISIMHDKK